MDERIHWDHFSELEVEANEPQSQPVGPIPWPVGEMTEATKEKMKAWNLVRVQGP